MVSKALRTCVPVYKLGRGFVCHSSPFSILGLSLLTDKVCSHNAIAIPLIATIGCTVRNGRAHIVQLRQHNQPPIQTIVSKNKSQSRIVQCEPVLKGICKRKSQHESEKIV